MNFGIDKDTSKSMFLVWFMDLKFAPRSSNQRTNFRSSTLVAGLAGRIALVALGLGLRLGQRLVLG